HGLLELVLGDAVAHQAADAVVALVDGDVMPGSRELLCRSQSRRAGDEHRYLFVRRDGGWLRFDDSVHPGLVGDALLDALDRDAAAGLLLGDGQHAGRLARRRAQAAGELREVVGGVQAVAGRIPAAPPDEVVPLGDEVAERTARGSRVAERDSAVHAAAGLLWHPRRPPVRGPQLLKLTDVA